MTTPEPKCLWTASNEACGGCPDWIIAWTSQTQGEPRRVVRKCMKALKEKWK